MFRCITVLLVSAMSLPTFLGCASTVTSNTPRTAKEQLLLSNSVDQALDKVDFTPLHSHRVFIDEKYLESVDKPYIVGSVRHRALRAGAVLADKVEDADIVMEVRSGGVGTDTSESYLGTPEIALPGMLTVPEIRLVERKTQFGYSKIGLVTYDAKSKQSLGDGGVSMAQSDDSNWFMFGVGPFQNGSLRKDVSRARINPPGMRRRELPSTVALAPRSDYVDGETAIRYASDSREVDGQ